MDDSMSILHQVQKKIHQELPFKNLIPDKHQCTEKKKNYFVLIHYLNSAI